MAILWSTCGSGTCGILENCIACYKRRKCFTLKVKYRAVCAVILVNLHPLKTFLSRVEVTEVHCVTVLLVCTPKNRTVIVPCKSTIEDFILTVAVNVTGFYLVVTLTVISKPL